MSIKKKTKVAKREVKKTSKKSSAKKTKTTKVHAKTKQRKLVEHIEPDTL